MNDIGYIDCEYKGSIGYNSVMSASKESLLYRRNYTEGAIKYHIEQNNPKQVKFFTDELNLIDKRVKKLSR